MSAVRELPNLARFPLSFCHTLEKYWLNFKSEKCGNFYKGILTRFFSSLQTAGILALETRGPGPFVLHSTSKKLLGLHTMKTSRPIWVALQRMISSNKQYLFCVTTEDPSLKVPFSRHVSA